MNKKSPRPRLFSPLFLKVGIRLPPDLFHAENLQASKGKKRNTEKPSEANIGSIYFYFQDKKQN